LSSVGRSSAIPAVGPSGRIHRSASQFGGSLARESVGELTFTVGVSRWSLAVGIRRGSFTARTWQKVEFGRG
jgi:hypothetical protein